MPPESGLVSASRVSRELFSLNFLNDPPFFRLQLADFARIPCQAANTKLPVSHL